MASELPQGLVLLAWMIGAGGITSIVVAVIGKRRAQREESPPQPRAQLVEVNSPWLVQNLLEMKMTAEANQRDIASLIKVIGDLVIQVNSIVALLKRRRKRSG